MIKSIIFLFTFYMVAITVNAQVDSVNTQTHHLKINQLSEDTKTYVVYLQDSVNGIKYNFEIWERKVLKFNKINSLHWVRNKNSKGEYFQYKITFDNQFKPVSEQVFYQKKEGEEINTEKKYFIYEDGKLFSSNDSLQHNVPPFQLDDLKHSLNWELDLETISALDWSDQKKYSVCFYHPGSRTPPNYYTYFVDRSEKLSFNNSESDCWVIKFMQAKQVFTEFWVDKKNNQVLVVKDSIMGKFRFKRLIIG